MMVKRFILIICIAMTSIALSGCNSNGTFWTMNSKTGSFQTNDIDRAQKEIDFRLVLPSFVPDGLFSPPTVRGQARGTEGHGEVEIVYNGSDIMFIYESSIDRTFILGPPDLVNNFTINGIQVQHLTNIVDKEPVTNYTWKQNGLSINVETHGIGEEKSKQIVTSMIT
jgi:hypothetical protein